MAVNFSKFEKKSENLSKAISENKTDNKSKSNKNITTNFGLETKK